MKCFKLLKTVLNEVWEDLPYDSDNSKMINVRKSLSFLHQHYRSLHNLNGNVNYSDPVLRYAYLGSYVTCHANMIYFLIEENKRLKKLFETEKIHVTCLGGGPGSDLLGILKYVERKNIYLKLKFFLYDREPTWSESWSDVDDRINSGINISVYFEPFDITKPNTWQNKTKYLQSNLFTMVYFISEIIKVKNEAKYFFEKLFSNAKKGSYFLFIDNSAELFYDWFDNIWKKYSIEIIKAENNIIFKIPCEEEKKDLGIHFDRLGESPKLSGKIAYRVLCKN